MIPHQPACLSLTPPHTRSSSHTKRIQRSLTFLHLFSRLFLLAKCRLSLSPQIPSPLAVHRSVLLSPCRVTHFFLGHTVLAARTLRPLSPAALDDDTNSHHFLLIALGGPPLGCHNSLELPNHLYHFKCFLIDF